LNVLAGTAWRHDQLPRSRDGYRGCASRVQPYVSWCTRHAHNNTIAMRATRDHSHSVCIDEERSDHLGCATTGAFGSRTCEVDREKLAQHSSGSAAIDAIRVRESFTRQVLVHARLSYRRFACR
jgi:hypothetical protein